MSGLTGTLNGQQDLKAGINAGQGTGYTRDYEKLDNKPGINGHTLIGESALEDIGIVKLSNLEILDIINRR